VKVSSSESGVSDGGNPSIVLLDEQHASKDDSMYQVMKSGQGMRKNPLVIIISSGGYLMDGFPFYERV
jgi:phage terminase large subunit-like protein